MLSNQTINYLKELETEAIFIIREVAAEFKNPVMLFSIGKDSCVMSHLAKKAFFPGKVPFPLMHIDSKWKFKEMIKFREEYSIKNDISIIVGVNEKAHANGVNPFTSGSRVHTDLMKTQALLQTLEKYNVDAAFGGARRDEEKSRAKERIFSFRNKYNRWDYKNQRVELWDNFNCRINENESFRIFPLSNWTELDIWRYILLENIEVVPLYFAKERPIVKMHNSLIMVDDIEKLPVEFHDKIENRMVRFRTLGCWPLTGAVDSVAFSVEDIVREIETTRKSERTTRVIDFDRNSTMEQKKIEGYF